MSQEQAIFHVLKQQWDNEDARRDELEQRAKQLFLEEHAEQIFAPIEEFLKRLDKVLRGVGGSVDIDASWGQLGDRRLRRVARVTSTESNEELSVDLTIEGARISYREASYQLSEGIEALIVASTRDVERFLQPREGQSFS
jgi:hypothetical protein